MQPEGAMMRRTGSLDSKSSIFSSVDELLPEQSDGVTRRRDERDERGKVIRNLEVMNRVLDPVPSVRERWQRKMVIRSIRRRGRLNRTETLLRTERSSLSKSHFFKTSVKKLMPLARQIAGKDIDEAILQMRFSKKKAATDILKHLKHAKNEAIVRSGMGLGPNSPYVRDAEEAAEDQRKHEDSDEPYGPIEKAQNPRRIYVTPETPMWKPKDPNPDLTKMYISQAWVGRGPYVKELEYRARGRVNILRKPYTSISVLLKEEKTKVREAKEKAEKEERRRYKSLWTQLPDRKITTQRQYYCW
jgi:ribosomal protein L22